MALNWLQNAYLGKYELDYVSLIHSYFLIFWLDSLVTVHCVP